ncbi:AzlC family ABC transporter permease [Bifidobacterium sp. ESL0745]|uniref:AzlC family ABC transporter permease n=1 Tax=Bifidobacterium sp. ESL0745 TaxID=2983226 RepID=UPI0023F663ED|nr:AzlC family ABC transporter permease [Bifidobacterium sp. ESL0745]MDF7665446.1 AzlC family ABC transporter permease [Bifidobacterium sp. ESL0745]
MGAKVGRRFHAFRVALPYTFPTWAGLFFPALSYGLLMFSKGFPIIYPICMSALIFAGSMEFVTIDLLLSAFNPLVAFIMTLMVNGRHIFYGLSMLDTYRGTGWKKPFLIFGMCDETFAVNSSVKVPEDTDRGWFMLWITLINWSSWVAGATLGWLVGGVLPFSTKGVEFAMTAMFFAIVLDEWDESHSLKGHTPAMVGVLVSLICLIVFGPKNFMLPTLLVMLLAFVLLRPYLTELKDKGDGLSDDIEAAQESSTEGTDLRSKTNNSGDDDQDIDGKPVKR